MQLLCVAAMVGWGGTMTTEAFEWVARGNAAVIACAKIGRFMNDIAAFKVHICHYFCISILVVCYEINNL